MAIETSGVIANTGLSLEALLLKYDAIEKDRAGARARARTEGLNALRTLIDTNADIKTLQLRGYTPSFNDGDPCVHRQRDLVMNDYDEYDDEDTKHELSEIPYETYRPLAALIQRMSKVFAEGFGTNWQIDVRKNDDGTVSWNLSDWDCGH